jgi:hypothetical protein
MSKGFGLALALASLLGLLQASAASACWLCKLSSGDLTCDLVIGESGGSTCYINCKSNGVCYCRTLGICSGTDQCSGSPCPTIHGGVPGLSNGASDGETVWLTRELFDKVDASNPVAAMLLSSLARDSDALSVGLLDRVPFQIGEFKGVVTVPSSRGKEKPLAYRYEASVTPLDGGVTIHIQVFDHPGFRSLDAQVWNEMSGTHVELADKTGTLRRIEL